MKSYNTLASTEEISSVDDLEIEILVAMAAAGDEDAWLQLWRQITPQLDRELARPEFLRGFGQRASDRDHVLAGVHDAVRARDFERLRVYRDACREHPNLRFLGWLYIVAKRVARSRSAL